MLTYMYKNTTSMPVTHTCPPCTHKHKVTIEQHNYRGKTELVSLRWCILVPRRSSQESSARNPARKAHCWVSKRDQYERNDPRILEKKSMLAFV